jgi:NADH dehydrogenase
VTAVTRNSHQKAYKLKTQANAGYLNIVQVSIFDEDKIRSLISKTDICINLIGILYEKNKSNNFENIHSNFPYLISKLSSEYNIKQFIHLSSLGIENAKDSNYANSKLKGEKNIKKNFPKAVIFRPSVVYSVDDNFTTNFMSLLSLLPFFPLYYSGNTKFSPIHCSDLTNIIYNIIFKNINSLTLECVGPEILSLKEILQRLLKLIDKKRLLIPIPLLFAKLTAIFFQLFPKPAITLDQIRLLKYDNIPSGKYKTNLDIGLKNLKKFDEEVQKYCYMWKKGGQFSTKK